ncbi:hypothetical protein BC827DRAFT_406807 [Russula dissimulans]|nr:hypothetical protein BC827DRAFT_406807 [Russula dissimulans]
MACSGYPLRSWDGGRGPAMSTDIWLAECFEKRDSETETGRDKPGPEVCPTFGIALAILGSRGQHSSRNYHQGWSPTAQDRQQRKRKQEKRGNLKHHRLSWYSTVQYLSRAVFAFHFFYFLTPRNYYSQLGRDAAALSFVRPRVPLPLPARALVLPGRLNHDRAP